MWKILRVITVLLFAATLGIRESAALSLQEGLQIVTTEGWDVKIASQRESSVAAGVPLARARRLPRIDLFGSQTILSNQPEAISTLGGTFPLSERDFITYGFTANQTLYDFGRSGSSLKAAKEGARAQSFRTAGSRNTAALNFILAYISLLEAERLLEVTEKEITSFRIHLDDANALFDEGVVTINDVLAAEVKLADALQRNLTSKSDKDLWAARLNFMILRPLSEAVDPEEISTVIQAGEISINEIYLRALKIRPDVNALRHEIQSGTARLRAIKAERYPSIFANGGYEYQENQYRVHQDNWTLAAGIKLSLYSGGSKSASVTRAEAELEALKAEENRLSAMIKLEIKDAYLDLNTAALKVMVAEKAVKQARENLRLRELSYEEGAGTGSDVQDAVALHALAEQNYWRAVYGRWRAQTMLLYAEGADLAEYYSRRKLMTSQEVVVDSVVKSPFMTFYDTINRKHEHNGAKSGGKRDG